MGERKVLNKYFPPDFDPAKLPKGKRTQTNDMKVRMMLPMSVRCTTCGNFMYKGTKFNTRKEDVLGENYLGIQIFRFYWRCKKCSAEFCMKTDPKSADYILEAGATRNYEPWRDSEATKAEAIAKREEEEMGNAMKALENRTLDSKREMDIMAALDEMKALKAQHSKVTTEQALAALQKAAQHQDLDDDDATDVAEFYQLRARANNKQLESDEEEGASAGAARARPSESGAGPSGTTLSAAGAAGGSSMEPGRAGQAGAGSLGSGPGTAASSLLSSEPQRPPPTAAPKPHAASKPAIKVMVKPKAAVGAVTSGGAQQNVGSKRAAAEVEAAEGGDKKAKVEDAKGAGLTGLLGGYGSSSGAESE